VTANSFRDDVSNGLSSFSVSAKKTETIINISLTRNIYLTFAHQLGRKLTSRKSSLKFSEERKISFCCCAESFCYNSQHISLSPCPNITFALTDAFFSDVFLIVVRVQEQHCVRVVEKDSDVGLLEMVAVEADGHHGHDVEGEEADRVAGVVQTPKNV
jgi:hypothetical protein